MFLTRAAWCLGLLFNEEETFQSVARLSYKDLCLLTGRTAFHRKAIMQLNKGRSNASAAN